MTHLLIDPHRPVANSTTVQEDPVQVETVGPLTLNGPLIKLFVADTDEHQLTGFTVQASPSYRINWPAHCPTNPFLSLFNTRRRENTSITSHKRAESYF